MFKRISGEVQNEGSHKKKASTAFKNGALVYSDGAGHVQPADSTSGNHIGVCLDEVKSTDDDYGDVRPLLVDVPRPNDIYEVDVETGTLTAAMVDNAYDLASSTGIDVSAQTKGVVTVVGFVSASKALVKINATAGVVDVATT